MASKTRSTSRKTKAPNVSPQEDVQPNELMTRRTNDQPPTIRLTTRPLPRRNNFGARKHAGQNRGASNFSRPAADRHPGINNNNQRNQAGPRHIPPSRGYRPPAPPRFPPVSSMSAPPSATVTVPPLARMSPVVGAPNLADMIMATASSNLRPSPSKPVMPGTSLLSPTKRRKVSVEHASSASDLSPRSTSANILCQTPPTSRESSSAVSFQTGHPPLVGIVGQAEEKKFPIPRTPVKRERERSPDLPEQPKLVSEGSLRFGPLPPNCQPTHYGYQANRRAWQATECALLRTKGLQIVRALIRFVTFYCFRFTCL